MPRAYMERIIFAASWRKRRPIVNGALEGTTSRDEEHSMIDPFDRAKPRR